jgi:acetyltransferase-like isoleucine patch superfamily enzyme
MWFMQLMCAWLPDNRISIRMRGILMSCILPNRPSGLTVGRDVTLLGIDKLIIGTNVYLAKGTWINAIGGVVIKDDVLLSPYVIIASLTHGYTGENYFGKSKAALITIECGCWIASHATITSGAYIAPCSLIAANSVVIGSTEPHTIYSGVPAKKIKARK